MILIIFHINALIFHFNKDNKGFACQFLKSMETITDKDSFALRKEYLKWVGNVLSFKFGCLLKDDSIEGNPYVSNIDHDFLENNCRNPPPQRIANFLIILDFLLL